MTQKGPVFSPRINTLPRLQRREVLSLALAGGLAAGLGRHAHAEIPVIDHSGYNCFEVLSSDPRFTTLAGLLVFSSLAAYAQAPGSYTMFAPTNSAFDHIPNFRQILLPGGSEAFPDTSRVSRYVRSHIVRGMHAPSEFEGKTVTLKSFSGTAIQVNGTTNPIQVTYSLVDGESGTGHISDPPILSNNFYIYPIDKTSVD